MRSFTIHVNLSRFQVSRKISAGWNDYRAVGTKCNDRMSLINCSQVPKSVA